MLVRTITRVAGPALNFAPGEELDLPRDVAESLIKANAVVSLESKPTLKKAAKKRSARGPNTDISSGN